ncbi:MAG: hypothetical protein ACX94B_13240 [Henriciella sp.]
MTMLGKCAGVVALLGCAMLPAVAQDMRSASEKVVACQNVADASERLACFESAAVELSALLAIPVAETPLAPTPTEAGVQTPSAAETQLVQQATTVPAPAPDAGQAPIQQAAVATQAESEDPDSRLPSWIPRITFGEQKDVVREPDQFETKLTRIQRNDLGRHFFTTAEGHVWKQYSIDRIKAPSKLPTEVVLDKNMVGGIRITILETNERIRVTRIE